jgi:hypothetical protein
MTSKPTPDELAQLDLDPIEPDLFTDWGGDRRSEDWRIKLAKKRGTARTRKLAMDAQAPLPPPKRGGPLREV